MPEANSLTPSGLLLLNKQPGITSFDTLRGIKRALGTGKVGHTGTLDKFAEGLLLVLVGKALKLSQWFTHCDKQYEGTICFGKETETLDPEGAVVAEAPLPSLEAVELALSRFSGEIERAPPAYSAIHIDGKRASALARQGETPEMKKRPVSIYKLELLSWEPPYAKIFVHCSSGTYIRSLARDIAAETGSRAHLSGLTRTMVAGFGLEDAKSINSEQLTINKEESEILCPIDKSVFDKLGIASIDVTPGDAAKVINGKPLAQLSIAAALPSAPSIALFSDNNFIALIEYNFYKWKYGYVYAQN